MPFSVTEHCLEKVELESVQCLDEKGESLSRCSVELQGDSILVEDFDSKTQRLVMTIHALDSSGNAHTESCETKLLLPPPQEDGSDGGCQSSPAPTPKPPLWLLLLLPLFVRNRRFNS